MKRAFICAFAVLCLAAALTGCGRKDAGPQESGSAPDDGKQTISGIVNRVDDYLVLLDDSEQYRLFDFGEDVDPGSLEEGDSVTVTYTGDLDSEDPPPVAVAIEKAA